MSDSNEKALAATDAKIKAVETALTDLDALTARQSRLKAKADTLSSQEQSLLHNAESDSDIAALITVRATLDVSQAQLTHFTGKIAAQEAVVIAAGRTARMYATEVSQLLAQHRLASAVALVKENFAHQPLGTPEHLARHDKKFQVAELLAASFGAYYDDVNEIASLRQLRSHFEPVVEAVKTDPSFELSLPEAWLA